MADRSRTPFRVGVLASGEGTNLQALLEAFARPDGDDGERATGAAATEREIVVVAVASDKPGARALTRAAEAGIDHRVFPRADHETREARDAAIAAWMNEQRVDLVVLAGYMAILTPIFIRAFPDRIVNVHPSLLPAFPGIRAIEQAVEYGVRVFGVTVHLVDEGIDTGAILLQDAIQIEDAHDPEAVHLALRPLEHRLLPAAVRLFARGAVRRDPDGPRRVRLS